MHPNSASRHPPTAGIHPGLQHFAAESGALSVRLLAYVGALALIAIAAVQLFESVIDSVGPNIARELSRLLPPVSSVQPAKQRVLTSPGIPVAGAPGLFLRGSL